MEWFNASLFMQLAELEVSLSLPEVPEDKKPIMLDLFRGLRDDLRRFELVASAATAEKIIRALEAEEPPANHNLKPLVRELRGRFIDEANARRFFILSLREAAEYVDPLKEWDGVEVGSLDDIIEASRCLALGRTTASVFHLVRVMESGLRYLAELLIPDFNLAKNPSWDAIFKKGAQELERRREDRSPEWLEREAFYSEAIAYLRAVRHAWRNPTMHVGQTYTDEQAREIYNAVRGFMRFLSADLASILDTEVET